MPGQYSSRSRLSVDTILDREIARQDDEMSARQYLAECDAFRNKLARRRIIEEASRESVDG